MTGSTSTERATATEDRVLDRTITPVYHARGDHCWKRFSTEIVAPRTGTEIGSPVVRGLGPARLRRSLFLADAATVFAGGVLAFGLRAVLRPDAPANWSDHMLLFLASFPICLGCLVWNRLYSARAVERSGEEFRRIWASCAMATSAMVAVAFVAQFKDLSRLWIVLSLVCIGSLLTLERSFARSVFRRLRATGRITRRVAVIGCGVHADQLARGLSENPALGYTVVTCIGPDGERAPTSWWMGESDQIERILREHNCGGAMISLASVPPDDVNRLTRVLTDRGFHVALSSSLLDISTSRIRAQAIDGRTVLYVEPTIRDGWRAGAKRTFDIVASVAAITITLPVMLITAAAVRLTSAGPILFRQERVGLDGATFRMYKFRTMVVDAEARRAEFAELNELDGPLFKLTDDPRITHVGKFLRQWSIDELPQFVNVLRGEMSVVGPRPALPREVAEWDAEVRDRLRVMPGITGLWQVAGRSNTTFDVYKRLDLLYVDNWSLARDVQIVCRTFAAVLLRRGAK